MADPRGFMTTPRRVAQRRPVHERIHDWKEVYPGSPGRAVLPIISEQAGRCMDCGIPFCHTGCPLGNLIPEWNDLDWRSDWDEALERLHATNNFPEFTGRLCPAPCETACVVGINRDPVTIKNVEVAIIDRAWDERRVTPQPPEWHTGKTVAVIGDQLRERYDAVVLAIGSTIGRDLPVPGRELNGIHQAMEYLPQSNRVALGRAVENQITAKDKHVVIIGGGDTGADCLGTAIRQQAKSIVQLEILPTPPDERPEHQPWPTYPMIYRVSSAHEEAGERVYSVSTTEFLGDGNGNVSSLRISEVTFQGGKLTPIEGTEREIPAELVLLAMGFVGPETDTVVSQLGVALDERGNIGRDNNYATDVDGVFACGDAGRGQSLIVWAIAEGRACAAGVDAYLSGSTKLPRPIPPTARQMMV